MLGKVNLKFLETPGHTPEGITILAEDTEDKNAPLKMFTGDTLFIGDVGRPDLIGSKGFTAEEMGGMLYDSLHEKILPLPDETEVYPAHGAGSLCGKSLSKETWSTLGEQRKTNYASKPMSKEEFIKIVAADQPEVPAYFPVSASQNLKGSVIARRFAETERIFDRRDRKFRRHDFRCSPKYGIRRGTHSERDQHRTWRTIRVRGRERLLQSERRLRLPPTRRSKLTKP